MREIRMLRSIGRGLETESRSALNGHEAGNGGYSQGQTYGPPRQLPTLPLPSSPIWLYVLKNQVKVLTQEVANLTLRMEEMEQRFMECYEDLRYRISMLTFGKIADPSAPYFSWLLERDRGKEASMQIRALFSVLDDRLTGEPIDDEERKRIKHVSHDLLYGSGPPAVADVIAAIKRVAMIQSDAELREFIKAMDRQMGIYDTLYRFVLAKIGE